MQKGKEAVIIGNPASGRADLDLLRRFAGMLGERWESVEVWPTEYPEHATELATRAGKMPVIAAGGDGTINEVVNGLETDASLGVIPLGTANVLARELGLPLDPEEACKRLLSGKERRIDLGIATGSDDGERRFTCMAGIGFDANVVRAVPSRMKRVLGSAAFALTAFKVFAVENLPEVAVESPQGRHKAQLAILANGRLYGGDFRTSEEASLTNGSFDVVLVDRMSRLLRPDIMTRILAKQPLSRDTYNFSATELRATSDGEVPVQLDGEIWGKLPMSFRIEPASLSVIS